MDQKSHRGGALILNFKGTLSSDMFCAILNDIRHFHHFKTNLHDIAQGSCLQIKLTTLMPGAEVQNAKLQEKLLKTNSYLIDGVWDFRIW